MVIAQIRGGLGNQLFQYAAAKSLSLHHNVPLLLEVSSFHREELPDLEVPRNFELLHFNGITEKIISPQEIGALINLRKGIALPKLIIPAHKKSVYTEPFYHHDKNFFKSKRNVFLKGGWQSEKYFKPHENEIRNNLHLKDALVERVTEKANTLKIENSVSVHVRRGDYLRKKIIHEWHGVMDRDYYTRAFELLNSKTGKQKIYYFTDDTDWVSKNLQPLFGGEIMSGNVTQTQYEDLYLMSQCRNNIIANSSFSWWGAWLNSYHDKIIIAPKKWFDKGFKDTQDVIPSEWIRI